MANVVCIVEYVACFLSLSLIKIDLAKDLMKEV